MDTAPIAFFIQWLVDAKQRRDYRKASYKLEYPFARPFTSRLPKG
jgi:hypothetical protein